MSLNDYSIMLIVSFLITVAGTGIGVFLAFLVDNHRENQSAKRDRRRILELLKFELEQNLRIMSVIKTNLDQFGVPFEHLSSSLYEGVSNKMQLLTDDFLFTMVGNAYHNFSVFENGIKTYRSDQIMLVNQPDEQIKQRLREIIMEQHKVIVEHLTPSEKGKDMFSITKNTISALDTAIKALDC